jgi:hypothetical protein
MNIKLEEFRKLVFLLAGNFFFIIFFLSFATSTPFIKFQHEEIQPRETILATIEIEQGNFSRQISDSDIKFFEGRKEIFIESKIIFYKGIHYLYAYPAREGNFTLKIQNILYKKGEELSSFNLEKQILIKEKPVIKDNISIMEILSVKPGFIFLEKEPKIKITNFGNTLLNLTIINLNKSSEKISLSLLETREFTLSPSANLSYFQIKTYKEFLIPVISSEGDIFIPKKETYLKSSQEIIVKNLTIGKKYNDTIQLFNFGEESITNIKLISDIDFLTFESIKNMSEKEIRNLSVYLNPKNPGHFTGTLNINYTQFNKSNSISVYFDLFVLPEESKEEDFIISLQTCSEIKGNVCTTEEICTGESTFTKGGEYCCLDLCEKIKMENGNSNWIIGVIILLLLGFVGYSLYKKSKKIKSEKPEEKIKEISDKYTQKMKGNVGRS